MKKKVAIFDIDGTIFRSSLLIELVEGLIREGVFPSTAHKLYHQSFQNWVDRKDNYEKYIMAVVAAFMKHIKGVRYSAFKKVSDRVVISHQDRVYRYTRDLIHDLKKRGYYLLAISQSPMELVQEFGKKMGFDKMYGRKYEVADNGKFTGKIIDLDLIADKSKVVKRAVAKEDLTLRGSYAVGDTEGDIPMLKMVDHPICFNPNKKLYDFARKYEWDIVVERKDMVYHL